MEINIFYLLALKQCNAHYDINAVTNLSRSLTLTVEQTPHKVLQQVRSEVFLLKTSQTVLLRWPFSWDRSEMHASLSHTCLCLSS